MTNKHNVIAPETDTEVEIEAMAKAMWEASPHHPHFDQKAWRIQAAIAHKAMTATRSRAMLKETEAAVKVIKVMRDILIEDGVET